MDKNHIKTTEQAQALPEIESEMFEYFENTDPKTGYIITGVKVKSFSPVGIENDDIVLFTDKDGRSMKVVGTETGPAKTEFKI